MKSYDYLSQFLIKLDRNKAPISAKSRNTPVWEIESKTDTVHAVSEVTISLYDTSGGFKWDGSSQWNGIGIWGDG